MDVIESATILPNIPGFAKEHVRRYLASNGRDGHHGPLTIAGQVIATPTLLIAMKGRKSGNWYVTPLTYGQDGANYILVGSFGGAPEHPGWAKNLMANPDVRVQVGDKRFDATVTVGTGAERERLWKIAVGVLPAYAEYQTRTTRQLPVFVVTPRA